MYFYPVALLIRHNSVDKNLNRYLYTVQPSLQLFFLGGPSIPSLLLQPLYNGNFLLSLTSQLHDEVLSVTIHVTTEFFLLRYIFSLPIKRWLLQKMKPKY